MKKIVLGLSLLLCAGATAHAFSDVEITHPSHLAVQYLSQQGVIGGYEDDTFRPEPLITRAAALKIILEATDDEIPSANEIEGGQFADVPAGAWFEKYVRYAVDRGIINWKGPESLFSPERNVNRAEFAKMALRAFDVFPSDYELDVTADDVPGDAWFAPYMHFFLKFNVLEYEPDTKNLLPSQAISRVEGAEMIFRLMLNGHGLHAQTMLNIAEEYLVGALKSIENADTPMADLQVLKARAIMDFLLQELPENKTVLGASKVVEALQYVVGVYRLADEGGAVESIIATTKGAWKSAAEAKEFQPSMAELADKIQHMAHELAEKARGSE